MTGSNGAGLRSGGSRARRLLSLSVSTRRVIPVRSCMSKYTLGDLAVGLL